jgi:lysophospholipase L1-like esterase
MTRYYSRPLILGAALIAVLGLPFSTSAADSSYYLSLGDSLAAGYQPNVPKGPWNHGYADQLFTALHAKNPTLRPMKLGCYSESGETTDTMINGGAGCTYAHHKSQLDAAVAFLHTHNVALITIDIGGNDVDDCNFERVCIQDTLTTTIPTNLSTILSKLRAAAGKDVPIVGMNYYDPYLAYYYIILNDPASAKAALPVFDQFNDTLERIYKTHRSSVANVEGAFSTLDFKTWVLLLPHERIPLDVARICQWTWMCSSDHPGDIHANEEGYEVISRAFLKALP